MPVREAVAVEEAVLENIYIPVGEAVLEDIYIPVGEAVLEDINTCRGGCIRGYRKV